MRRKYALIAALIIFTALTFMLFRWLLSDDSITPTVAASIIATLSALNLYQLLGRSVSDSSDSSDSRQEQ